MGFQARRCFIALLLALAGGSGPLFVATRAIAQDAPAAPAPVPESSFRARIVRPGTIALHGEGEFGMLLDTGRFGKTFENGPGLGFGLRYRNSSEAALGLSFEAHYFNAREESDSAYAPDRLQMVVTTLEYYRYFSQRSRTPRHLMLGVGLVQTRQENVNGEREFPGDGGAVKAGGGVEYWAGRTFTLELNARYCGVLSRSKMDHGFRLGLGFNFYTSP